MNEKVSVLSGTASLGIPIAVDKKMDCIFFTQRPHPFGLFKITLVIVLKILQIVIAFYEVGSALKFAICAINILGQLSASKNNNCPKTMSSLNIESLPNVNILLYST